jgi:hypothetical protein
VLVEYGRLEGHQVSRDARELRTQILTFRHLTNDMLAQIIRTCL